MQESIRKLLPALRASVPFWSIRCVEETREALAVRQDTIEPPRLTIDRGVMITAIADGGYGYCATSDLTRAGLQAALDRACAWAEATRASSVYRYSAADMPAPVGERGAQSPAAPSLSRSELYDLLADECRAARIDARIVERYAGLELR